jgi:hypothetical protein
VGELVNLLDLINRERFARTRSGGEPIVVIWWDLEESDEELELKIAAEKASGRIGPRTQVKIITWKRDPEPTNITD